MQIKSFTFSKFTIEQELKTFEARMRDEGYTIDEFTEADLAQSMFASERKPNRRTSGDKCWPLILDKDAYFRLSASAIYMCTAFLLLFSLSIFYRSYFFPFSISK